MHNTDTLPWFLVQGHGIAARVWWYWIALCVSAGVGSLVWWWRWGSARRVDGLLREVVPPLGLILLGCSMLFLPAGSGLDVGLIEMDDVLLWAFLPEAPAASVPTPPISMASGGRGTACCDLPSGRDCGEASWVSH